MFSKWNCLLRKYLDKRKHHGKLVTELLNNITAVSRTVKPTYLLDFSFDANKLLQFVKDLYDSGCIDCPLNIYQMGTDLLIVNPKSMNQHKQTDNIEPEVIFVDVSSHLNKPAKVEGSFIIKELVEFIWNLPADEDHVTLFDIEIGDINLTTVFGLLLGYPFVYWFNCECHDNNLSMEPLKCFEISQTLNFDTSDTERNQLKIISFSIPETIYDEHADLCVSQWFDKKKRIDPSLKLSSRTEVLSKVAL